jgi:hypothetical protein
MNEVHFSRMAEHCHHDLLQSLSLDVPVLQVELPDALTGIGSR